MDSFDAALDRLIEQWTRLGETPGEMAHALREAANELENDR